MSKIINMCVSNIWMVHEIKIDPSKHISTPLWIRAAAAAAGWDHLENGHTVTHVLYYLLWTIGWQVALLTSVKCFERKATKKGGLLTLSYVRTGHLKKDSSTKKRHSGGHIYSEVAIELWRRCDSLSISAPDNEQLLRWRRNYTNSVKPRP